MTESPETGKPSNQAIKEKTGMYCETWAPTTSDNMKMGYSAVEVLPDYIMFESL